MDKKIYILGKDKRQQYLKKIYNTTDNIEEASVVVLPIPLSRDLEYITGENIRIEDFVDSLKGKIVFSGGIAKSIRRLLEVNNVEYYDLMDRDDVAIKNAIPTAEGAIKVAMEKLDKTIYGLNVLVLGFGRVGKVLADRLYKLGANVYCEARKEKDLAEIYSMGYNGVSLNKLDSYLNKVDIIFNTVPFMILTKKRLENLNPSIVIIDLASAPGGVDYAAASSLKLDAGMYPGLPSKVAPYTAAIYLKDAIDSIITNI